MTSSSGLLQWDRVNYSQFKFIDSVEVKGDGAHIHVGVIAQDAIDVFNEHGLDANKYGILCHDTWITSDEVFGDDEVLLQAPVESGERYGVRYEELLAFIIAAL